MAPDDFHIKLQIVDHLMWAFEGQALSTVNRRLSMNSFLPAEFSNKRAVRQAVLGEIMAHQTRYRLLSIAIQYSGRNYRRRREQRTVG
ncbi:hypothetical protein SBA4_90002 [Candidatus Sulfopaludibacter sp. SbA4]|nr:hypothetical protein SBA4_90002 [Candidatus Sulfopaludibacter sp. SbA4]